jgi:hypothetical protein
MTVITETQTNYHLKMIHKIIKASSIKKRIGKIITGTAINQLTPVFTKGTRQTNKNAMTKQMLMVIKIFL